MASKLQNFETKKELREYTKDAKSLQIARETLKKNHKGHLDAEREKSNYFRGISLLNNISVGGIQNKVSKTEDGSQTNNNDFVGQKNRVKAPKKANSSLKIENPESSIYKKSLFHHPNYFKAKKPISSKKQMTTLPSSLSKSNVSWKKISCINGESKIKKNMSHEINFCAGLEVKSNFGKLNANKSCLPLRLPEDIPAPHEKIPFEFKFDYFQKLQKNSLYLNSDLFSDSRLKKRNSGEFENMKNFHYMDQSKNEEKQNYILNQKSRLCNASMRQSSIKNEFFQKETPKNEHDRYNGNFTIKIQINENAFQSPKYQMIETCLQNDLEKLKNKFGNWIKISHEHKETLHQSSQEKMKSNQLVKKSRKEAIGSVSFFKNVRPLTNNIILNTFLSECSDYKFTKQLQQTIWEIVESLKNMDEIVYHKQNIFTLVNLQIPLCNRKFQTLAASVRLRVICMLFAKYVNRKLLTKLLDPFYSEIDFGQEKEIKSKILK